MAATRTALDTGGAAGQDDAIRQSPCLIGGGVGKANSAMTAASSPARKGKPDVCTAAPGFCMYTQECWLVFCPEALQNSVSRGRHFVLFRSSLSHALRPCTICSRRKK